MNGDQQQRSAPPDFSQAIDYTCEKCGFDQFVAQFKIKKFSALMSPTGQEQVVPIQCFACAKCMHINSEWLPDTEQLSL